MRGFFQKGKGLGLKRSGLEISEKPSDKKPGPGAIYFERMEEAIVAVMSDRFMLEKVSTRPEYARAFENMSKIKRWMEQMPMMFPGRKDINEEILLTTPFWHAIEGGDRAVEVLESDKPDDYKLEFLDRFLKDAEEKGFLIVSDRVEEQKEFFLFLDELVQRGVYRSNSEAFDAFAIANFSGNILGLGKHIDGALGKGSFRKIAERFKEVPKPKSTISKIADLFKRR